MGGILAICCMPVLHVELVILSLLSLKYFSLKFICVSPLLVQATISLVDHSNSLTSLPTSTLGCL